MIDRKLAKHWVFALAVLGLVAGCGRAQEVESSASPVEIVPPAMRVTVLGSGTPVPSQTQSGAAILVEVEGETLLFDCGRACTQRLAEYNPALINSIDHVFLTHLHSDHVVGLPDLWLNGWTQGRAEPLKLWGPVGTTGMMEGLVVAFAADLQYRGVTDQDALPAGLQSDVTIIGAEPGLVYESGPVRVIAFPVVHGGLPAYGYRVESGDLAVMISGDTTWTPTLVEYGQDAELVLLEVLSPAMVGYIEASFTPDYARSILNLHLTAEQAGRVFAQTRPELGAYYHTVADCQTDPGLLEATRSRYDGEVVVARDLVQFQIAADGSVSVAYLGEDKGECDASSRPAP